jgi:hypothetical protein
MNQKEWIQCVATLCFLFGLAKVLWPRFFIDMRRSHPWFDLFDFYSFVFKSKYAERAVRVNGCLLLVISVGFAVWTIFK